MPKRSTILAAKRRDRKSGQSPYRKHNKAPFDYSGLKLVKGEPYKPAFVDLGLALDAKALA